MSSVSDATRSSSSSSISHRRPRGGWCGASSWRRGMVTAMVVVAVAHWYDNHHPRRGRGRGRTWKGRPDQERRASSNPSHWLERWVSRRDERCGTIDTTRDDEEESSSSSFVDLPLWWFKDIGVEHHPHQHHDDDFEFEFDDDTTTAIDGTATTNLHPRRRHGRVDPCRVFSETYIEARQRFRAAVSATPGWTLQSLPIRTTDHSDDHQDTNTHDTTTYTIDVAVQVGHRPGWVVHVSGTHGVEGYAGSAIQVAYLEVWRQHWTRIRTSNTTNTTTKTSNPSTHTPTILLVHAFNPVGMARYRRFNEHNVDLNRNGVTVEERMRFVARHADAYTAVRHVVEPTFTVTRWPPWTIVWIQRVGRWIDACVTQGSGREDPAATRTVHWELEWMVHVSSWWRTLRAVLRHGVPKLKAVLVRGQYHAPHGLFYGGGADSSNDNPDAILEPSVVALRDFWRRESPSWTNPHDDNNNNNNNTAVVTWIDVHTGLGVPGQDTILTMQQPPTTRTTSNDAQLLDDDILHWFPGATYGSPAAAAVNQGYEDTIGGLVDYYERALFRTAESTPPPSTKPRHLLFVQEFGTVPSVLTGHALVCENALYHHTPTLTEDERLAWARRTTGRVFYPQRHAWRRSVLKRGVTVLHQAVQRSLTVSTAPTTTAEA